MPLQIDETTGVLNINPGGNLTRCSCVTDCSIVDLESCPQAPHVAAPTVINAIFEDILRCVDGEPATDPSIGHLFCMEYISFLQVWIKEETVGGNLYQAYYDANDTSAPFWDAALRLGRWYPGDGAWRYLFFLQNEPDMAPCVFGTFDNGLVSDDCFPLGPWYGGIGTIFASCGVHLTSITPAFEVCSPPAGGKQYTFTVTIHNESHDPVSGVSIDYTLSGVDSDLGTIVTDVNGIAVATADCLCVNGTLRFSIEDIYGTVRWDPEEDETSSFVDIVLSC